MSDTGFAIFLMIVVIIGTIFGFLAVKDNFELSAFCDEKGFESKIYQTKNMEEGYIKCCNTVVRNHEFIDKMECEVFKYE